MAASSTSILPAPAPSTGMLEDVAASLAFELAQQLLPWRQVIARYGLTENDLRTLMANPAFIKMLEEAKATWEGAANIAERVRLKSQFVLETALLPIAQIIHDGKSGTQAKIDATKLIASIAGMSKSEAASQQGSGFGVNIYLGDKSVSVQPSGPLLDASN